MKANLLKALSNWASRKFWITVVANLVAHHAMVQKYIEGIQWLVFMGASLGLYLYAQGQVDIHRIKAGVGKDGFTIDNTGGKGEKDPV